MCVMIGYFVGDQPMRIFFAHTVVRSRKIVLGCWVGRLRPGLFVHGKGAGGGLADWSVQQYNCTLILSQAVGFTIFPHSHVHSPARELNGSTPLVCGWDLGSSAMLSPYVYDLHFQALWSSDSENYISSVKLIETLRERVCLVCVCVCVCVCWTNWLSCLNL